MGLFKPDLYRNFGIGFFVGALAVVAVSADNWRDEFNREAQAATAEVEAASPTE